MSIERESASPRRGARALGAIGQVLGVAGVLASLALVFLALVARHQTIDRVTAIADRVDASIARALPLLSAARERVDAVAARVTSAGEALRERAASDRGAERLEALRAKAADLSDRHQALRAAYADAHEKIVTVLERLEALDDAVPAISIPRGPVDAIASLDKRVHALDAKVATLIDALSNAGSGVLSAAVDDASGPLATALAEVASDIASIEPRVERLRSEVADRASNARARVTWLAVAVVAALLYVVFLHVVLFRSGRRAWRPCQEAVR